MMLGGRRRGLPPICNFGLNAWMHRRGFSSLRYMHDSSLQRHVVSLNTSQNVLERSNLAYTFITINQSSDGNGTFPIRCPAYQVYINHAMYVMCTTSQSNFLLHDDKLCTLIPHLLQVTMEKANTICVKKFPPPPKKKR